MPTVRGPVRARDLRANMREHGDKEGMIITMEQMLDERVQDREQIRELAAMVDRCVDLVTNMTQVGNEMKNQLEDMRRKAAQGDAINHGNS